jgi:hypothetical protein
MRFIALLVLSLLFVQNVNAEEYDLAAMTQAAIDQRCDKNTRDFCNVVVGNLLPVVTEMFLNSMNEKSRVDLRINFLAAYTMCMNDYLKDSEACTKLVGDLSTIALTVLEASLLKHDSNITEENNLAI